MQFCLDTSAFINAWNKLYPEDVFPTFWQVLGAWCDAGDIIAPKEVLVELEQKDDELHRWAKQHLDIFLDPDEDVQRAVTAILADYPSLVDEKRLRSMADPWVVAQAQVSSATVVSEETPRPSKPRIPDVCVALGIPHTDVVGLMRTKGLRL